MGKRRNKMDFESVVRLLEVIVVPILVWIIHEISGLKKEFFDFMAEVEREFSRKEDIIRIENKFDSLYQLIMDRLPKKGK